jgi:hypothetical protein
MGTTSMMNELATNPAGARADAALAALGFTDDHAAAVAELMSDVEEQGRWMPFCALHLPPRHHASFPEHVAWCTGAMVLLMNEANPTAPFSRVVVAAAGLVMMGLTLVPVE